MAVLVKRVLWYRGIDLDPNNEGPEAYQSEPIDLTNIIDFSPKKGIDIKNNVVVFNLKTNFNRIIGNLELSKYVDNDGNILFEEQDQIVLFFKYTDGADVEDVNWNTSLINIEKNLKDNIIGFYYVVEYNVQHTNKGTVIKVTCADKNYVLFNKVLSESFLAEIHDKTAPQIIQEIIQYSTENLQSQGKYGGVDSSAGVSYDIDAKLGGQVPPNSDQGGYITSIRSDGSAFPPKSIAKVWKPIYEWIQELSTPEFTNYGGEKINGVAVNEFDTGLIYGRNFIFYVDETNKAHWYYPNDDTNAEGRSVPEIKVGTDKVLNINLTKKVFDTVSMIIFCAGEDMYGNGIWGYVIDTKSSIKAFKMRVIPLNQITTNLIAEDYKINTNADREGTPPGLPMKPGQFPLDAKYGGDGLASCAFYALDIDYHSDDAAYKIKSDADYNSALRQKARRVAQATATKILNRLSNPRWAGTMELKGRVFTAGDLIKLTDTKLGLNELYIRITDVTYNITKEGWFTTLELEEDEEALISASDVTFGGD